jgi:hypothetical protein
MINSDTIEAWNTRQTLNPNSIKKMTPAQADAVKMWGSTAENLMKNKDLAHFVHEYKFELCDQLADIRGHTADDNARRVAISNQLAGIDGFIALLKRAVYYKNTVVSSQAGASDPTVNI